MALEPIYTPIEVAEILGIRPRTLDDWRLDGKGPRYFKIGGLVRYEQSAVQAFIDEAKKASA